MGALSPLGTHLFSVFFFVFTVILFFLTENITVIYYDTFYIFLHGMWIPNNCR